MNYQASSLTKFYPHLGKLIRKEVQWIFEVEFFGLQVFS